MECIVPVESSLDSPAVKSSLPRSVLGWCTTSAVDVRVLVITGFLFNANLRFFRRSCQKDHQYAQLAPTDTSSTLSFTSQTDGPGTK